MICRKASSVIAWTACCLVTAWGYANESGLSQNESPRSRPNIVLIMADDLGWKDLHCYGNASVDTPVLDRMAERGMRFTNAYSASPVCTPSRAAIMTGLSPARLQITNHAPGHSDGFQLAGTNIKSAKWNRYLALDQLTLAERLQEAGYHTAFVGKWHLSHRPKGASAPVEADLRPQHQGFDINIGGCDYGGPPGYFEPFRIPEITPGEEGDYLPDRLAKECISFIRQHRQSDRPFFLCWWNYSVHYPFEAPQDLIDKYERRKSDGGHSIRNPVYYAMIEGMDRSIGRLLESVERLDPTRSTLVIFTSDNGPFAADVRPLRGEKGYLYEGGIRVPLIVNWEDQVPAGATCDTPVVGTDLCPTILAAAEIEVADETFDGCDLLPLLASGKELPARSLYFHYPNYAFHKKNRLGSAMRYEDYKLIRFYDDNSVELYNLADDIGESRNLAESMPELANHLNQQLSDWLKATGASLPQPAD